jgi:glutamine synthetase
VNSYRRLAPEISAPINLNWGMDNRTVAFRVPNSEPQATRIENRFPGADANPYLADGGQPGQRPAGYAGGVATDAPTPGHGERGRRRGGPDPGGGPAQACATRRPCRIFGDLFLRAYTAVKLDEFEEFNRVISSWEREHLLLQV